MRAVAIALFLSIASNVHAAEVSIARWENVGASDAIAADVRRAIEKEIAASGLTLVENCKSTCISLEAALVAIAGSTSLSVRVVNTEGNEVTTSFDEIGAATLGLPSLRSALENVAPAPSPSISGSTYVAFGTALGLGALSVASGLISSGKEADFEAHVHPSGEVFGLSREEASSLESGAVAWAWTRNSAIAGASIALALGVWSLIDDLTTEPR